MLRRFVPDEVETKCFDGRGKDFLLRLLYGRLLPDAQRRKDVGGHAGGLPNAQWCKDAERIGDRGRKNVLRLLML